MCKTYDAIYEIAKFVESDILICQVENSHFEGELHKCDCYSNDCKCEEGIVTLKNATVTCASGEKKEYKWINISSKHIASFAFKCCEIK